jgi:hypothetical protein
VAGPSFVLALWYNLKSGFVKIVLFTLDFFGYLGSLCFHMNFRNDFAISGKNDIEIFDGYCIKCIDWFC